MPPFTSVVEGNPIEFFKQELPRRLPNRFLQRFIKRQGARAVADAIGALDPERFEWMNWFEGEPSTNGQRNAAALQRALAPIYALVPDRATETKTIFRLLLVALAGKNEEVVKTIIIPELRLRGIAKGYAHSQINPQINPWPPYAGNDEDSTYFVYPDRVDLFLRWWDQCA